MERVHFPTLLQATRQPACRLGSKIAQRAGAERIAGGSGPETPMGAGYLAGYKMPIREQRVALSSPVEEQLALQRDIQMCYSATVGYDVCILKKVVLG